GAADDLDDVALARLGARPLGICLGSLAVAPSQRVRAVVDGAVVGVAVALVLLAIGHLDHPDRRADLQRALQLRRALRTGVAAQHPPSRRRLLASRIADL